MSSTMMPPGGPPQQRDSDTPLFPPRKRPGQDFGPAQQAGVSGPTPAFLGGGPPPAALRPMIPPQGAGGATLPPPPNFAGPSGMNAAWGGGATPQIAPGTAAFSGAQPPFRLPPAPPVGAAPPPGLMPPTGFPPPPMQAGQMPFGGQMTPQGPTGGLMPPGLNTQGASAFPPEMASGQAGIDPRELARRRGQLAGLGQLQ